MLVNVHILYLFSHCVSFALLIDFIVDFIVIFLHVRLIRVLLKINQSINQSNPAILHDAPTDEPQNSIRY